MENKEEMKIIEKEKEKNRNLLELGKKFNEVESDFEIVCQSQKDILNSFCNYEIIFDKKK